MHCGNTHYISAQTHHESWESGGHFDSELTINGWCSNRLRMLFTSWNHKFTIHTGPSQKDVATPPLWWMMVSANVRRSFEGGDVIFLVLVQPLRSIFKRITADDILTTSVWSVWNTTSYWIISRGIYTLVMIMMVTARWFDSVWFVLNCKLQNSNQTRKPSNNIPVVSREISHSVV